MYDNCGERSITLFLLVESSIFSFNFGAPCTHPPPFRCTCGVQCVTNGAEDRSQGITELAAHHFIPFLRFCAPFSPAARTLRISLRQAPCRSTTRLDSFAAGSLRTRRGTRTHKYSIVRSKRGWNWFLSQPRPRADSMLVKGGGEERRFRFSKIWEFLGRELLGLF